jgi:hypothetical protein
MTKTFCDLCGSEIVGTELVKIGPKRYVGCYLMIDARGDVSSAEDVCLECLVKGLRAGFDRKQK